MSLTTDSSGITVPPTVTIAAGKTSSLFEVDVPVQMTEQSFLIKAQYGGNTVLTTLEIAVGTATPPVKQMTFSLNANPIGYASQNLGLFVVKPENGLTTVTIDNGSLFGFYHCTGPANPIIHATGVMTYACNTLEPNHTYLPFPGVSNPFVTQASLSLTLVAPTSVFIPWLPEM